MNVKNYTIAVCVKCILLCALFMEKSQAAECVVADSIAFVAPPFTSSVFSIPAMSCNTNYPWKLPEFDNLSAQVNDGVGSLIPLCIGSVNNIGNLIDNSTSNFATISITGINCDAQIGVRDNDAGDTYTAGTYAGYRIGTAGLIGVTIASAVTISTYNNGALAESEVITNSSLAINSFAIQSDGTAIVGFRTTLPFDEIRIRYQALVSVLFTATIYHPVIKSYCAGPLPVCNTATSLVATSFPAEIDDSGVTGLGLGGISNEWALVDTSLTNSATVNFPLAILASAYVSVKDQLSTFPAGYFAGYEVAFPSVLSVNVAQYTTITTYLNDVQQESFSSSDLLISTPLFNDASKIITGFVTSLTFDEIRIQINQPLSINLGAIELYRPVIKSYCEGPALVCNSHTDYVQPDYPVDLNASGTGFSGLACLACEINNPTAIINDDTSDYVEIDLLAALGTTASLSFQKMLSPWSDSIFVGFDIVNENILDVDILDAIQICTYENGILKECKTGSGGLIQIDADLWTSTERRSLGFVTHQSFDQLTLSFFNTVSVSLGSTKIYALLVDSLCHPNLACDTTFYINRPAFPAFIDGFRTGLSGVACVLCDVENPENVISQNTADYAEINITAGVAATGSIAVQDGLTTYPLGCSVGFAIEDMGGLIKIDLFESITICTYLDGALRECKSGNDLIDLTLVLNLLGPGPGKYNVGFQTSMTFDEISITIGSLVSAFNSIRVYGAFVDTRGGVINGSTCCVYPNTISYGNYCEGQQLSLSSPAAGYWTSSDLSVAIVSGGNTAEFLDSGSVVFSFYNNANLCLESLTSEIAVNGRPIIGNPGTLQICVGENTSISPSTGGSWTSTNASVASITDEGVITGIIAGSSTFIFTSQATGCSSNPSTVLTVNALPIATYPLSTYVCMYTTAQLNPVSGGSWVSSNAGVATITNAGVVQPVSEGQVQFTFTNATTGCHSAPGPVIQVVNRPVPDYPADLTLCQGASLPLTSDSVGNWYSTQPHIASIDINSAEVIGLSAGRSYFYLISTQTQCSSDSSLYLDVIPLPSVSLAGPAILCQGFTSTLTSLSAGVWSSLNGQIASIDALGNITALAPGKVGFVFADGTTGCESKTSDELITVQHCMDPDFNVGFKGLALTGNLATNDEVSGAVYSNSSTLISKPPSSAAILTIQPSGAYSFVGDEPGRYQFQVPVCLSTTPVSCMNIELTIHLVERYGSAYYPIVNTDMITILNHGLPADLTLIAHQTNDKCVTNDDCSLMASSFTVVTSPADGTLQLQGDDSLYYLPDSNLLGMDTLVYQYCSNSDPLSCDSAKIIITVADTSAENMVVAVDDFFTTRSDSTLIVSLTANDSDPEGHSFFALSVGSEAAPVVLPQGRYYISAAGILTFIPTVSFSGALDIVYTICDDGISQACAKATAHLLVFRDLKIRLKVYLEGALINSTGNSANGKPLMRDNLRNQPTTGLNYLPTIDPYHFALDFVDLSDNFTHVWPGTMQRYCTIPNSASVMAVTGENAIVDWVFVELRNKNNPLDILATRSALLQRDGDVVDLNGTGTLAFRGLQLDSCYVAVKHRAHLGVMSKKINTNALTDFTSMVTQVFDFGTSLDNGYNYANLALNSSVKSGYKALWAGDFVKNGKIKFTNPNDDLNTLFFDVLTHPQNATGNANYDHAYGYYQGDYNMDGKIKFDNPFDDKNLLYAQILFYPLNNEFLSNFDFFIEQIP
jgi:hypothetical protein